MDSKLFNKMESIILDIALAHNGIRWVEVVQDSPTRFYIRFFKTFNEYLKIADNLTGKQVLDHLKTMVTTIDLYNRENGLIQNGSRSYITETISSKTLQKIHDDDSTFCDNLIFNRVKEIRRDL